MGERFLWVGYAELDWLIKLLYEWAFGGCKMWIWDGERKRERNGNGLLYIKEKRG